MTIYIISSRKIEVAKGEEIIQKAKDSGILEKTSRMNMPCATDDV
jgi:hypothetical protein